MDCYREKLELHPHAYGAIKWSRIMPFLACSGELKSSSV